MNGMFDNRGPWDARMIERPVVSLHPDQARAEPVLASRSPGLEVLWNGVFYGFSGYAKANREITLRLANSFRVAITHAIDVPPPDAYSKGRVDFHLRVPVSEKAPMVRMFGPWVEKDRHKARARRVLYTMMETENVHPTMVGITNDHYDELWVPTPWNRRTFQESGCTLPIRVMPLGIDPYVFRPDGVAWLPECYLMTTTRAGAKEVPRADFLFMYVFLPSFRKAGAFLLDAFRDAFRGDPSTGLILAMTHTHAHDKALEKLRGEMKSPVWALFGEYTEHDLAAFYRACNAYVSTSKGEGWNLPMCEAAACGLPLIVPRSSCHPDVVGEDALLFEHEGWESVAEAERISPWYENMPWPIFGKFSHDQLVAHLRDARTREAHVREKAERFTQRVRTEWTWDNAARNVADRLVEIQP